MKTPTSEKMTTILTRKTKRASKLERISRDVETIKRQILALQLVIREMAEYSDAISEDVDDLLDESPGGGGVSG
jgi:hypothetical protein